MRKLRAFHLRVIQLDDLSRDVALYCLAFGLLRILAVFGRSPALFNDSPSYMRINFLGHATRLWTVPLFYSALPNDKARVVAQIIFGIACWSALAFSLSFSLKNRIVARLAAILVLLLGLCIQVTEWDQTILSESVALSLTALLVAALLWLQRRRSKRALAGTLIVLALWVFTRQLQAFVYVLVSLPVITWILLRARRYVLIALALAFLAVWGGYAAVQAKGIIQYNTYYLLTTRILRTPGGAEFFARRGMPDMPALVKAAAEPPKTWTTASAAGDPRWQAWIDRHWTSTYVEWLLRHPIGDIRSPIADAPSLLSGFPPYGSPRPVLPSPLQDGLWERSLGDLPLWLALVGVVWLAALRVARPSSLDALGAGIVAVSVLWYLAAWHLSSTELPRLSVEAAALLRVGLYLLLFAALDRIALRRFEANRL